MDPVFEILALVMRGTPEFTASLCWVSPGRARAGAIAPTAGLHALARPSSLHVCDERESGVEFGYIQH
jgi:hypothetical protein